MSCERPLSILNPKYRGLTKIERYQYANETYGTEKPPDEYIEVPCGHCQGCEKSRQYEFSFRLRYELASHPPNSSLFVTLTFDNESLVKFKDDLNKPVRRFLDVLRKRYGKSIRHWFVCEFGTLRGRPHYHGILFGCPEELINGFTGKVGYHRVISKLWKHGISFTGYVNDKTCTYVSKYVTKSLNGKYVRPRLISSFGIGEKYLEENSSFHKSASGELNPLAVVGGKPMALPRYYYNKIFTVYDKQNLALDRYLEQTYYWKGVAYTDKKLRDKIRSNTFCSNLIGGLSFRDKFPSKKRNHKFSKLLTFNPYFYETKNSE